MDEVRNLQQKIEKDDYYRELILQLKAAKENNDYTLQDIVDLVNGSGEATSISTARRIFKEGSENSKFSYKRTLKPYAKVLLEITPEAVSVPASASDEEKDIAALKSIILAKEQAYSALEKQNDFLLKQYEKTHKSNRRLFITVIVLLVTIIIYLIVHDVPNPEYGLFQFKAFMEETAAIFTGQATGSNVDFVSTCLKV